MIDKSKYTPSKKEPLTDLSPMPFGKHKGTNMAEVPASYFWYLWSTGMKSDTKNPVHVYIKENLSALKQEHPDGIW